jgi:predicted O-methyltransferase YrrM
MKGVPLNEKLYQYIVDTFAKEDELLRQIVKETEEKKIPLIQISPELGKFLYVLIKSNNSKRVLEIGALTGYSTIWMARALPDDGKLTTLEISKEHADAANANYKRAGLDKKINLILGSAMESLDKLANEKFDFVFIDADKISYPAYYEKVIKMMNKGGIITADNTLKDGRIIDRNPDENVRAIQVFNKTVADDPRVDSILVPICDGLTMAVVK